LKEMKWARHQRVRTLLISIAFIAAIATIVARISRTVKNRSPNVVTWSERQAPIESPVTLVPTPPQNGSAAVETPPPSSTSQQNNIGAAAPDALLALPSGLIIPVMGVRADQLHDTFSESRSEGRVHDAIDIPAPHGATVVAATDGPIVKLFQSKLGGVTIYQLSTDGKFVYYYAHLDRYVEGLIEGHVARQGETIGFVGDTGNAGAGNYHLHFSIAKIADPKDFWHGQNINPYPLLRK
jgi:peptidoglycan LD-endopeptidase LytH